MRTRCSLSQVSQSPVRYTKCLRHRNSCKYLTSSQRLAGSNNVFVCRIDSVNTRLDGLKSENSVISKLKMTEGVSEITRRKRCSARGGMSVREASSGSREKISSTDILIWKSIQTRVH